MNPGRVPLRPLTLLIGENSTGKTAFLAAVRIASDISYSGHTIDFNERPFQLGSFNEIAHYKGGARRAGSDIRDYGRRASAPAWTPDTTKTDATGASSSPRRITHSAVFRRSGSHPVISSQSLRLGEHQLTVRLPPSTEQPILEYRVGDSTETIPLENLPIRPAAETAFDWSYALYVLIERPRKETKDTTLITQEGLRDIAEQATRSIVWSRRPICIAPVRTTPLRTYDPVSDTPVPEGAHIPMVLAKLFFQDKDEWKSLKETLDRFGKESGLFTGVYIKALGRYESDPFQIRVGIKGPQANLVDVGYGVSQALPILVEALRSDRDSVHLMQQPEVHMHPRSQAALGSFLADLAATQRKQFIVETHSDYLVDRVRMDIRDGKSIKPEDVVLLYFERQGSEISIHPITINADGNLMGEPDTYRKFFLNEEGRFLGV